MIVFGNIAHGHAIAVASGTTFNPEVDRVIARVENGQLLGGVTYQGYTGASIQMHMAGFDEHWANRDVLWVAFDYPFNQLGCKKVFGQVPETNARALEIDLKLGFKIVAKVEDVFPDGACYVLALAREDCRWLKLKPRSLTAGTKR
jgi:RimJ/RimL family protein N-acetyltransferase